MSAWFSSGIVLGAIAITYVVYIVYATVRVVRSLSFSAKQKTAQVGLILFVPVVGVLLVHIMLRSDAELPKRQDKNFIPLDIPEM